MLTDAADPHFGADGHSVPSGSKPEKLGLHDTSAFHQSADVAAVFAFGS